MSRLWMSSGLACCVVLLFALPSIGGQTPAPTKMTTQRRTASSQPAAPARSTPARHQAKRVPRSVDRRAMPDRKHKHHDKQEAEIDSLDAELRHDGCFWLVEIEYEVDLEGFDSDEAFVLGMELLEDDKPVLDDTGEPIVVVVELDRPAKVKKSKQEFEGRLRMRVHKDWVRDDDDLEVNASLVRAADGRVFDVEDESADLDRPGPTLSIGVFGIGISIPL